MKREDKLLCGEIVFLSIIGLIPVINIALIIYEISQSLHILSYLIIGEVVVYVEDYLREFLICLVLLLVAFITANVVLFMLLIFNMAGYAYLVMRRVSKVK